MEAAPYDNVEFPVRKPGAPITPTGTWPGPGGSATSGGLSTSSSLTTSSSKTAHSQSLGRDKAGGAKLAPLLEVEMVESEDQRMQANKMHLGGGQHSASAVSNTSGTSQFSSGSKQIYGSSTTSSSQSSARSPSPGQGGGKSPTLTPTPTPTPTPILVNQGSHSPNATIKLQQPKSATFPPEEENLDEFSRHNFNPASQALLDKAYTDHRHFYRLTTKILDEGSLLKQDVLDMYRKAGETLSYEQLLQGMLLEGERLLIGGCWLYFTHVDFLTVEGDKNVREPLGKGRLCLTSHRVLLLSTEISTDASISEFGDPTSPSGGYKVQVKKGNSIYYQNLPLRCFHSAELDAAVGTAALTKISVVDPICWGICSCFGVGRCVRTWKATPPLTKIYNRRMLRLGVSMPPWDVRTCLQVHLDPEMSLTTARDFISHLQTHAPHMQ